jgi:hypothetical protein
VFFFGIGQVCRRKKIRSFCWKVLLVSRGEQWLLMRWLGKGCQVLGSRRMSMKMRRFLFEAWVKCSFEKKPGKVCGGGGK